MVSNEMKAAQDAYEARPFAVRWCDSHASLTNRFNSYDEAYTYVQQQWIRIQNRVAKNLNHASQLGQSYLITPAGRVQLSYVLLCPDVSSYR